MKLNYYIAEKLLQVEVFAACPGCGEMKGLAMHVILISPIRKLHKFHVGCRCGWEGPESDRADQAALLWDARSLTTTFQKELKV